MHSGMHGDTESRHIICLSTSVFPPLFLVHLLLLHGTCAEICTDERLLFNSFFCCVLCSSKFIIVSLDFIPKGSSLVDDFVLTSSTAMR